MIDDRTSIVLRTIKLASRGTQIADIKGNPPLYIATFECVDGSNSFEITINAGTDQGPGAAVDIARSGLISLLERLIAEAVEGDLGHGYVRL